MLKQLTTRLALAASSSGRGPQKMWSDLSLRGRHFCSTSPASAATKLSTPVNSLHHDHKVIFVGAGSAGMGASHQLLRSGSFKPDDIAIVDPATWHHYQPGWTLVGGGLKNKDDLRQRMGDLVDPKHRFYNDGVQSFNPDESSITLVSGDKIRYQQLIVCPGISIKYDKIDGLPEALADPSSPVSSIYGYDTCDKVFGTIEKLRKGNAIFTQPTGVVKCAGAPQKMMWLALDHWRRAGVYQPSGQGESPVTISFATGLPVMFGVAKYSRKLEELRQNRGVEGLFQHDLTAVDGNIAHFSRPDGSKVARQFDLLHVVPKMAPHSFAAQSPLANEDGFIDVDQGTLRHKKYNNVWSMGDASSLPTSKTAAAITAQQPVLVSNLLRAMEGKEIKSNYDGYTSCPLTTEYGKVLLAEFKYGGEPKETFGGIFGIDQSIPRRAFYHLKKDFFPWVYQNFMVKGRWAGPKGFNR